MKNSLIIISIVVFSSCLRLDSNLYSPTKLEKYELNNSTGHTEISVGVEYDLPENLIHLFTLNSQGANEDSPTKIYAVYIGDTNRIGIDTVITYCHGNSYNMDVYWSRAKLLANLGKKNRFGVLMMDYRGYGMSEGEPTEEGLYTDVNTCLTWLKDKGLTNDRLIIYGFSMGTAPATELTANPRALTPSKLILEAPFASAAVMVDDASLLANTSSFYTNLAIDNAEEIKKVQQPFLWIHGKADAFLSIETHGEVVYKNYQGSYSKAVRVENGAHSDVPAVYGYENYLKDVLEFIER